MRRSASIRPAFTMSRSVVLAGLVLLMHVASAVVHNASLWGILDIWNPNVRGLAWPAANLSSRCGVRMDELAYNYRNSKIWAMKMVDASGRPPSKLLYGNEFWLGSRVECDEVAQEIRLSNFTTMETVFKVVHFTVNVSQPFNIEFKHVALGLCVPLECDHVSDVAKILKQMVADKQPYLVGFKILHVKNLPSEYSFVMDPVFITMLILCSLLVMLMIAGTVLDVLTLREFGVIKTMQHNKLRVLFEVILAFSIRRNVRRFFSTRSGDKEGSLTAVHGIRVVSFSWVMTCHTCLCIIHFSDNKSFRPTVERDFLFQMLTSGTFSVDSFFFLSGLLISYVFLRIHQETIKKMPSLRRDPSDVMKFVWICVYRFVRLTPPYLFVIGVVIVTMRQYVGNSVFEAPNLDLDVNCAKYWWRNLLYINTFFPGSDMCMGWSWYLSIDSQLYVVATALLIVFVRRPIVACALGLAMLIGSWVISAVISVQYALQLRIDEPFALYDFLYDKPWTRIGPYIVGMVTGWLLATKSCSIKMNKVMVVTGWTMSLIGMFVLVHALHGHGLGVAGSAAYVAFSHTLWAVAVAWALVACTTGHGGWITKFLGSRLFVPFSRGTYCAYLIHSAVIQWVFLNMDAPITMTRDITAMFYIGFSMSSYCLGVFISMAFEAPFISILSLARRSNKAQTKVPYKGTLQSPAPLESNI